MPPKRKEQLPPGWTEQSKTEKGGRKVVYYMNTETGQKFYTKDDLLRYVKTQIPQHNEPLEDNSRGKDLSQDSSMKVEANGTEHPEWLPNGWTIELKARKSGSHAGKLYKIYIDPVTGSKFFSKPEVLRHLESAKDRLGTSERKRTRSSVNFETKVLEKSTANDLPSSPVKDTKPRKSVEKNKVPVESTVKNIPPGSAKETRSRKSASMTKEDQGLAKSTEDDLPPGWIKEIKTRPNGKKDPFYIDPVSRLAFSSKKDVFRYLETGETSACKIKPKGVVGDGELINDQVVSSSAAKRQKLEPPTTRRQLFLGKGSADTGRSVLPESASLNRRRSRRLSSSTDFPGAPATDIFPDNTVTGQQSSNVPILAPPKAEALTRRRSTRLSTEPLNTEVSNLSRAAETISEGSKRNRDQSVAAGSNNHQGQNLPECGAKDRKRKSPVSSNKSKNGKTPDLPRRSSNRLAGSEPDSGSVSVTTERVLRSGAIKSVRNEAVSASADTASMKLKGRPVNKPTYSTSSAKRLPSRGGTSNKSKRFEVQAVLEEQQREQNSKENITDKSEPIVSFSFGDSLLDPCLENAFKALMGETHKDGAPAAGAASTPAADIHQGTKTKRTRERKTGNNSMKSKDKQKLDLPCRSSARISGLTKGDVVNVTEKSSNNEAFADANGASSEQFESGQGTEPANLNSSVMNIQDSSTKGKRPVEGVNVEEQPPNLENKETEKEKPQEQQPQVLEKETSNRNGNSETLYLFGQSFEDPCLDFAFKTLTGAIPVDENLGIHDYFQNQADPSFQNQADPSFQNQADPSQTKKNGNSTAPDFSLPTSFEDASVNFDAPEKHFATQQLPVNPSDLPSGNVTLPASFQDTSVHFGAPEKQIASQQQFPENSSDLPSGSVTLPTSSSSAAQKPSLDGNEEFNLKTWL